MEKLQFKIENTPAVIYGEASDKVYLFIHGKMGYKEEAEAFSEIVCPMGYQVLGIDLPGHGERKNETDSFVPWKIVPELETVLSYAAVNWRNISVRANSIGAWFCMLAYADEKFEKCLFVSPVLDMVKLIENMMKWASVTEDELRQKKTIATDFGETLSWDYYQYAKSHLIAVGTSPTSILYAEKDNLTDYVTVRDFADKFHCNLAVMKDGEHWFHTPEQLHVLKQWESENCLCK